MIIGFDLDNIFINHPPYVPERLIEWLYKEKTKDDLLYRIPSKPEQVFRLATHARALRRPIRENLVFLENLTKNHTITCYLISSRFGFLRKKTEAFIKQYNFDTIFDGMYCNYENKQPHIFKNAIIKELHVDRYVDDDRDLLMYLAKHNSQTQFFWLNKKIEGHITGNLFAITRLQQIV